MMFATIAAKELKSLFASPLAWIVLTVLQFVLGYVFLKRLDDFLQIQPQLIQLASPPGVTEMVAGPTFALAAIVLLFAVPLLAMRAIAEERRNQTMVFLMSAPVSVTDIVLGKFCGLLAFLALIIALVTLMPLSLAATTQLDYGLIGCVVLGLLLLAANFAAVGLYVSSLTAYPVAAALGAFAALLAMMLMGDSLGDGLDARAGAIAGALAQVFAPLHNFEPLGKGLLDSAAIVCSLLLTVFFLVLTVRRLDLQRVRG